MWLLNESTQRRMHEAQKAGFTLTAEQQESFAAKVSARDQGGPSSLTLAGDVAEIRIEGVLTKHPDWFAAFFLGGNTAYTDIQAALAVASADPGVRSAQLFVDSPGGEIDGLFDALAAIEAFDKPMSVRADSAFSAAYAIAAVAGKIEATGVGAMFGSIGTAASFLVATDMSPVDMVHLTNTDSPDKRPDVRTDEGKAVVVKQLDAIYELFADAIADGRGVSASTVTKKFGRGASFLAAEAKERNMIDSIVGATALRVVQPQQAASSGTENKKMDAATLAAQHPALYAQIVQEGITLERDRVCAHLTLGQQSGVIETAVKAIEDGDALTSTWTAVYMAASMNRNDAAKRQADSDGAAAAADGANTDDEDEAGTFKEKVLTAFEQRMGVNNG